MKGASKKLTFCFSSFWLVKSIILPQIAKWSACSIKMWDMLHKNKPHSPMCPRYPSLFKMKLSLVSQTKSFCRASSALAFQIGTSQGDEMMEGSSEIQKHTKTNGGLQALSVCRLQTLPQKNCQVAAGLRIAPMIRITPSNPIAHHQNSARPEELPSIRCGHSAGSLSNHKTMKEHQDTWQAQQPNTKTCAAHRNIRDDQIIISHIKIIHA